MAKKFETTKSVLDYNFLFLEELLDLDYQVIDTDERDYLFSQLEKTIGILFSLIKKHGD